MTWIPRNQAPFPSLLNTSAPDQLLQTGQVPEVNYGQIYVLVLICAQLLNPVLANVRNCVDPEEGFQPKRGIFPEIRHSYAPILNTFLNITRPSHCLYLLMNVYALS